MSSPALDPILRIGTLDDSLPRRSRFALAPISMAAHAAVVMALILVPIFGSADLPEPTSSVRAFLVEPPSIGAPPPPPPPPAPAASAASRSTPQPAKATAFVAPVETPDVIAQDTGLDLGIEGGVPGGVEGGVAGGVVGGIVGGLPAEAPPPVAPIRVGGKIVEPRKLRHVDPDYPMLARDARIRGVVILEAIIGADGRVNSVKVLRSVPLLDEAAIKAVRQWVYTPTLLGGVPVPVIMNITLQFSLRN
jgi:protein TonB